MWSYFAEEYLERTTPLRLIRTRFETPEEGSTRSSTRCRA